MKATFALLFLCFFTFNSESIEQAVSEVAAYVERSPFFLGKSFSLGINSASSTAFTESNNYRKTQGKVDLVWDDFLYQLCVDHNVYQISKATISHDGFTDRCNKIVGWTSCAENVAYNYDKTNPGKAAVTQWINSSGHRANLLSSNKYMGVSGETDTTTGRWYFCQFFANHS